MKVVILHVGSEVLRPETVAAILSLAGPGCAVGYCPDWSAALDCLQIYMRADTAVIAFITSPDTRISRAVIDKIHDLSPATEIVSLRGKAPMYQIDSSAKSRLGKVARETRAGQKDMEKKLNAAAIQRMLIEREAEKMSRRLTTLQNDLKNNLFIRSVLHTLINMLQVQISLDKEENTIVEEMKTLIEGLCVEKSMPSAEVCRRLQEEMFPRLDAIRTQTDENIHQWMMGYVKAVQHSLMGKCGFLSNRATSLNQAVERLHQKYADELQGITTGKPVTFQNDLPDRDRLVWMYDFALVSILENLLTNSLRKLLETEQADRRIRVSVTEELVMNERFLVLVWEDNGPGIPADRKHSIFSGDSDKTEEGDHGVGLSMVKMSMESAGGFARENGVPGRGAQFLLGFPQQNGSS